MREKVLIFIPYQDTDNFYSDGIMTREYAILYLLWKNGYKNVINIKKPRTFLDKKSYVIHDEYYPLGTVEHKIKRILDDALTLQYLPIFSINQVFKKRGWWINGYKSIIDKIKLDENKDYLVYSDNPYAAKLLKYLSKSGCKVFFDIMDNFVIHPSLSEKEHLYALEGYKSIFRFADIIAANSKQTCEFMKQYSSKKILLVKNGVFANNEANDVNNLTKINTIREAKRNYNICVGYIGKLGLRLDAELIDEISKACNDILFVFVGGFLKGQLNDKLTDLFRYRDNILHIDAVPSAYVYSILNEFDILSIPHAIGKSENGGDPLKLYQYLTRKKMIISTPILGVDEFKNDILILKSSKEWIEILKNNNELYKEYPQYGFYWEDRLSPVLNILKENMEGNN